jgi:hypothetical protein|uniref:Uncharacterized protein n=1 Tax=Picea glauca TaxID=3330 RepID=A0A101M3P1_PICGL|nr:hypothetical protein ABT39_MTgene90 [Picea glauca]KUM50250.1 hypothetical protein ABT39_MTgene93 [Picea glauca]
MSEQLAFCLLLSSRAAGVRAGEEAPDINKQDYIQSQKQEHPFLFEMLSVLSVRRKR